MHAARRACSHPRCHQALANNTPPASPWRINHTRCGQWDHTYLPVIGCICPGGGAYTAFIRAPAGGIKPVIKIVQLFNCELGFRTLYWDMLCTFPDNAQLSIGLETPFLGYFAWTYPIHNRPCKLCWKLLWEILSNPGVLTIRWAKGTQFLDKEHFWDKTKTWKYLLGSHKSITWSFITTPVVQIPPSDVLLREW